MKRMLLIAFITLASMVSSAQKPKTNEGPPPPPPRDDKNEMRKHNCARNRNESSENRMKKFPFSQAYKVVLVSFPPKPDESEDTIFSNLGVPLINDTLRSSCLLEIKTLSHSQIDTLTDILYNYGFAGHISTEWESLCFIPRNAIVFLDYSNKVYAYYSICFECQKILGSMKELNFDLCEQKISMIRNFFPKRGIEFGITKGTLKTD